MVGDQVKAVKMALQPEGNNKMAYRPTPIIRTMKALPTPQRRPFHPLHHLSPSTCPPRLSKNAVSKLPLPTLTLPRGQA